MGLLDGGLAAIFGAALGPMLSQATLLKATRVEGPGGGFSTVRAPFQTTGQIGVATPAMRAAEGFTDLDAAISLMQIGRAGQLPRPSPGDQVTISGQTFSVGLPISDDPAHAAWDMRGTPTQAGA